MKNAQLGEPVADFEFRKPDGTPVRLHEFLGKPLVLVLLRHLA